MRRARRFLLSLAVGLLVALPALAEGPLAARIEEVLQRPEYRQARWGLLVVDARTGQTIYQRNADQSFVPGSTIKLFHAAAALAALGPDYRFTTPVYARGDMTGDRLRGDLVLVAQGDLTLGGRTDRQGRLAFTDDDHTYANAVGSHSQLTDTDPLAGLKSLAKQVAAAGIRQVEGDVLIDDRLFPRTRGSGSGPEWLSPIVVNDNVVDVLVAPGSRPGDPARVSCRPATPFLQMDAQVLTVPEGHPTYVAVHPVGPNRFTVRGQIVQSSRPLLRFCPVDDPAGFARALFLDALQRAGVSVAAHPLQTPPSSLPEREAYRDLRRVATYVSPPFSELVKVTLKASPNLYADTFALLLGARRGQPGMIGGLQEVRRVLAGMGLDLSGVTLATAGGGRGNLLTPRATVQLFQALARRPDYPLFHASLPVLGVDGTLADVVAGDSPVRGQVQAKTGTSYLIDQYGRGILESKALAGTLTTARGRPLFFAVFVNNVRLPAGVNSEREGRVLGQLCEILYRDVP